MRLLPHLPKTCEPNILLLFAAVNELGDPELMAALQTSMWERLVGLADRSSDGFLEAAAVVLGLDGGPAASRGQTAELWAALLRHDAGDAEAMAVLDAIAAQEPRTLETILAQVALMAPPRQDPAPASAMEVVRLRVRVLDQLDLDDDLVPAAEQLVAMAMAADDADAVAEALCTAADSCATRGLWPDALRRLVDVGPYLPGASGARLVHVAVIIDAAPPELEGTAVAARHVAAAFADRPADDETDLVILNLLAHLRNGHTDIIREQVVRTVVDRHLESIHVRALGAVCATADDESTVLALAAEVVRRGDAASPIAGALPRLARAAQAAGQPALALAVADVALAGTEVLDDREQADLVASRSAALMGLGRDGEALAALVGHLGTTGHLGRSSDVRIYLLTALMRVAFLTHRMEAAVAPTYELRCLLADPAVGSDDLRSEVVTKLGVLQQFIGAPGSAQRYFWEPVLRHDLADRSDRVRERSMTGLGLVRAALDSASDDAYNERVVELVAEDPEPSGKAGWSTDLDAITEEHVDRHLADDMEGLVDSISRALELLSGSDRDRSLMATGMRFRRGLARAAAGDLDAALDDWLAAVDLQSDHVTALGAVAPLEDLREPCAAMGRHMEVAVRLALAAGSAGRREPEIVEALVGHRALWVDMRIARRRLGADAASAQGPAITAARRALTRLGFDGPSRQDEEGRDHRDRWWTLRRQRDELEIAGAEGVDADGLGRALRRSWERSDEQLLAEDAVFVGLFVVGDPRLDRAPLSNRLEGGAEDVFVVTVTADERTMRPLGPVTVIDEMAEAIVGEIRNDALERRGSWGQLVAPLREALLPVLAPVLDARRGPIYLMGEGALAEVPWSLVLDDRDVRLVESYRSVGVPRSEEVRLEEGSLVVGRPSHGPPATVDARPEGVRSFADLPSTGVEAVAVAARCGAAPLLDADATANAVLSRTPSGVVHVASHAFYLRGRMEEAQHEVFTDHTGAEMWIAREDLIPGPLNGTTIKDPFARAGIALADVNTWLGDDGRDAEDMGLITAADVAGMDLGAVDCAVLSACSAALGRGSRGAGSRGMRLALGIAGASWTIASLWPAPDVATTLLIEELYGHLAAGASPPAALRAAQELVSDAPSQVVLSHPGIERLRADPRCTGAHRYLDAIEAQRDHRPFVHPYFWAGFVVSC